VTSALPSTGKSLRTWFVRLKRHTRQLPFWVVQTLVLVLSGVHFILEASERWTPIPGLYLLPISTLFIPVVYAALNFGVEGALPTGLLCVALSLPNVFLFHEGAQRIGVLTQLTLLLVLGVIVAARVDREQRAKERAETANRGLQDAQDSLRSYVQLAMRAQERERQRLSRELHDETIQDLVVVRNSLRDPYQPGESLDQRVRLAEGGIDRSIDGIRRLCRALRPSILDDLGLLPAIEALTAEVSSHSKLDVSMDVEGTPSRLQAEAELAVYRVVQEALHNVERHASAARATVELTYDESGTRVSIVDDGQGFDPTQVLQTGRLGLMGMRERARLVGGELQLSRSAGLTRVVLWLPNHGPAVAGQASRPSDA
jgi:two-component system, NarL family, sensor histidine kinase DegS